jgi:hypothetical protein
MDVLTDPRSLLYRDGQLSPDERKVSRARP